jgi:hypothetical protein
MDTAEYTIRQVADIEVYAEVRYTIQPAYGDGWNEPHEPAHVELGQITLHKRSSRKVCEFLNGRYAGFRTEYTVEDLGPAPSWVDDIIAADEDWQSDLIANDGPCPDRAYDEARDDALMGGR